MTKETKVVDVYQDEAVVADMKARYTAVDTDEARAEVVAELSAELGKSVASIRSKLVREKVYVAKTRTDKTGKEVVSKGKLVDQIAEALDVEFTDGEAVSLEKATKSTLRKILAAVEDLEEATKSTLRNVLTAVEDLQEEDEPTADEIAEEFDLAEQAEEANS